MSLKNIFYILRSFYRRVLIYKMAARVGVTPSDVFITCWDNIVVALRERLDFACVAIYFALNRCYNRWLLLARTKAPHCRAIYIWYIMSGKIHGTDIINRVGPGFEAVLPPDPLAFHDNAYILSRPYHGRYHSSILYGFADSLRPRYTYGALCYGNLRYKISG